MVAELFGGVNAMPAIGSGIATIMMSSTLFSLASTGGSMSGAAAAVPAPAHAAAIRPAAEIHRRIENSCAVCSLGTGASFAMRLAAADEVGVRHETVAKKPVVA
jgi:hypothetical protein